MRESYRLAMLAVGKVIVHRAREPSSRDDNSGNRRISFLLYGARVVRSPPEDYSPGPMTPLTTPHAQTLQDLRFDNRFTRDLPADPSEVTYPRQVFGACFSRVKPAQVSAPQLVAYSAEVATDLGLSQQACLSPEFAEIFAGNRLLEGMDPHASCYGGHQFGHWAGQLGDGRAINLGETVNSAGERQMLQLKGAGPTPYSRSADGLAVLRSSLREFLCSEAMFHLGVPTTRSLSLVLSGEQVVRDMLYDGHPRPEPGAIVCRVAPSFVRFGSFEIFAHRRDPENLTRLLDFTIANHFPQLGPPSKETYVAFLAEVGRLTAEMMVHWARTGFVHGVMNTDNMSILGLTIDYGPYGWLDDFDPDWTPNTTDASHRRYRYGQQGQIALWNLFRLAEAIYPVVGEAKPLQDALEVYRQTYDAGWQAMMAAKIGLGAMPEEEVAPLVATLLELLSAVETDMTRFFRRLADLPTQGEATADGAAAFFEGAFYVPEQVTAAHREALAAWLRDHRSLLRQQGREDSARREQMNAVNPKYVLRNYLAQLAIDDAEAGDFAKVQELLELLRRPYDEQPEREAYAALRPDWARNRVGCSMLSCSS